MHQFAESHLVVMQTYFQTHGKNFSLSANSGVLQMLCLLLLSPAWTVALNVNRIFFVLFQN